MRSLSSGRACADPLASPRNDARLLEAGLRFATQLRCRPGLEPGPMITGAVVQEPSGGKTRLFAFWGRARRWNQAAARPRFALGAAARWTRMRSSRTLAGSSFGCWGAISRCGGPATSYPFSDFPNFFLTSHPKQEYIVAIPSHLRGVSRSSRTLGAGCGGRGLRF